MNELNKHNHRPANEVDVIPDLRDAEEARKAFIAGEIFNRKY